MLNWTLNVFRHWLICTKMNWFNDLAKKQTWLVPIFFSNYANAVFEFKNKELNDIHHQLSFYYGNIMHDLIIGRHFAYNDNEFIQFKECLDRLLIGVSSIQMLIVDSCPMLRFFLPAYWQYHKDGMTLQNFFIDEIEAHLKVLDPNPCSIPKDFIDAYLSNLLKCNNEGENQPDTKETTVSDNFLPKIDQILRTLLFLPTPALSQKSAKSMDHPANDANILSMSKER